MVKLISKVPNSFRDQILLFDMFFFARSFFYNQGSVEACSCGCICSRYCFIYDEMNYFRFVQCSWKIDFYSYLILPMLEQSVINPIQCFYN